MLFALLLASAQVAAPAYVSAAVEGSIEATLVRAAPDDGAALAAQVARLVRWRGDVVRNVHRNDRIDLLYEPGETPELLALSYEGLQVTLRAYLFTGPDGVPRYYDESGLLVEPVMLNPPAPEYVQITEGLQHGRGKRRHNGVDLKAEEGSPVVLPFGGVVTRINWNRRINGKCVEVASKGGRLVRFLHLVSVAPGVRPGVRLAAGAPIGGVGTTGRSGAPHLHYEVRDRRDAPIDPLELHGTEHATLPDSALVEFHRRVAEYDHLLGASRQPPSAL